jgi:phage terminase large subunit
VATGADSKIFAIGNPDKRGTEFYRIFNDAQLSQDWLTQTISVFDLPTFTGERVYEDDALQERLLSGLTSVDWVEHKKRAWGEDSARYKAKVLGEFPDEGDSTFFPQAVIDRAYDTVVVEDEAVRPVLGVDIARFGSDENRMYVNRGGRIRRYDDGSEDGGAWSKTDLITTARKVHAAAQRLGARLVAVDANGVGGGVVDALLTLDEFRDAVYDVAAVMTANASPDNLRWFNQRSYYYDMLREGMAGGSIDLDYDDTDLREELISQTYKFSAKGAVQITSKDEMKKQGLSSPDSLDAVLLSTFSVETVEGPQVGEVIEYEPLREHAFYSESFW